MSIDIIVVTHPLKDCTGFVERASKGFGSAGVTVHTHKANTNALEIPEGLKAIIAYGGDGTFTTAMRLYGHTGVPIAGTSNGNVGFLTPWKEYGMKDQGEDKISQRWMGSFADSATGENQPFANDLVIRREDRKTGKFWVRDQRGRKVTEFRADGVILSTPTGSTAYNLSAGGPIVHPTMQCMIITPICAIAMGARPIVVPMVAGWQVTEETACLLSVELDGISQEPEHMVLTGEPTTCNVLLPGGHNFYELLEKKLGWNK